MVVVSEELLGAAIPTAQSKPLIENRAKTLECHIGQSQVL